ncbi:MAG TPA: discoidin domain-containing protein [Euzebyales bacterium]|nr:discoidin domain-containing protein [Euzebyales bacterium]
MNCAVCGAPSSGGQFCVGCGEPLGSTLTASRTAIGTRERPRPAPGAWLALQEIRLVACPRCGAPNSAARWRCARCGQAFDDRAGEDGAAAEPPPEQPTTVQPEPARWLVLITAAAGVAVIAVAVMMLTARGVGPFRGQQVAPALAEATPIEVAGIEVSQDGPEGATKHNLTDGDPATSWQVAGTGVGEWVELRFGQPVQIDHLLIWNGDQRTADSFAAANRVQGIVIEFPNADKVYEVETLPDIRENVRVTMKARPPVADRIRIRITSVHDDVGVTALSGIAALAHGAPPVDEAPAPQ